MTVTNRDIVEQLQQIGQVVDQGMLLLPTFLDDLDGCSHINRRLIELWQPLVCEKDNQELIHILMGLTYVERELRWEGGSVSGVIGLFDMLKERDINIEQLDEVTAWIIQNSRNPYNPFGTIISLGARNYSQYKERHKSHREYIEYSLEQDKVLDIKAKEERRARKIRKENSKRDRLTPIRQEINERVSAMPIQEQLKIISEDDVYAPNFYSSKIAGSVDQFVIKAISEEVVIGLATRLKGKQRGPWASLKKRLHRMYGPFWNKEPWF